MEVLVLPVDSVVRLLKRIIQQRLDYLPKYIQGEIPAAIQQTLETLENLGWVRIEDEQVYFMPIFGKLAGDYAVVKEDSHAE